MWLFEVRALVSLRSYSSVIQPAHSQCESSLSTMQDSVGSRGAATPSQGCQSNTGIPCPGQTQVSLLMYQHWPLWLCPRCAKNTCGVWEAEVPVGLDASISTACGQAAVERLPNNRATCLSQCWAHAKLKMTPWGFSSNIKAVSL